MVLSYPLHEPLNIMEDPLEIIFSGEKKRIQLATGMVVDIWDMSKSRLINQRVHPIASKSTISPYELISHVKIDTHSEVKSFGDGHKIVSIAL